jgi:antiviral helicase SKI2
MPFNVDVVLGNCDDFDLIRKLEEEDDIPETNTHAEDIQKPKQDIDDIIPDDSPDIKKATLLEKNKKKDMAQLKEWAHVVDVNLPFPDFYEKVPELAHKFPFELDLFQKRAVYHLENGESVFVAAHS